MSYTWCISLCALRCVQVSYVLVQFDSFVCPIEYNVAKDALSTDCERSAVFQLTQYALPQFIVRLCALVCIFISAYAVTS